MNLSILSPVALCLVSLILTIALVRNGRPSMGLPVAYLYLLLLIHVPGALAHLVPDSGLEYKKFTETGIRFTSFATLAFVVGLWMARLGGRKRQLAMADPGRSFLQFCLIGGWIASFGLRPVLGRIPSLQAVLDNGSRIWLLAVMLAMPLCLLRRDWNGFFLWMIAMLVYPAIGLVGAGFLSFGTTTTVVALSLFPAFVRSCWKLTVAITLVSVLGMGFFVTYFTLRDDIRNVVWAGDGMEERLNESGRLLREFKTFDPGNQDHLKALNVRLNQNVFVGMAAERLERGLVEYYRGRTFREGVLSLVPRVFWPDKPVSGGSHGIINKMTEFEVNEKTTSYGVGNVMEFYINFGISSLVLGFLVFGWVLGRLDRMAAKAWLEGRVTRLIAAFLPAVAIIRPEHSTVEMVGGAAGALAAAWAWSWAWKAWGGGGGAAGSSFSVAPDIGSAGHMEARPDVRSLENPEADEQRDWKRQQWDEFRF